MDTLDSWIEDSENPLITYDYTKENRQGRWFDVGEGLARSAFYQKAFVLPIQVMDVSGRDIKTELDKRLNNIRLQFVEKIPDVFHEELNHRVYIYLKETLQNIAVALEVPISDLFEQPAKDIVNCPYCGSKIKIGKE